LHHAELVVRPPQIRRGVQTLLPCSNCIVRVSVEGHSRIDLSAVASDAEVITTMLAFDGICNGLKVVGAG